jgi:hypothetical protein
MEQTVAPAEVQPEDAPTNIVIAHFVQNMLYSARQEECGMEAERKGIETLGWYTPAEMSTLDFCPADAELLPVVFGGAV